MIYDVVVIGAGQAGLSMGYYLRTSNLSYVILDRSQEVGDAWRKRYDSLVLFTPRSLSSLHGLAVPGDQTQFATKDEIADYLEDYARTFHLPIEFNTEVKRIRKMNTIFTIETQHYILKAHNVVIATGPFQKPLLPTFSTEISSKVVQLHSSQYRNPSQLQEGNVLVVGGGNSGSQIAIELAQSHETSLSVGQPLRFLPSMIFGKSAFWWLEKTGILKVKPTSFIGKRLQTLGDPIIGSELKEKIKSQQILIKGRAVAVRNDSVIFEDHSSQSVDNIIWATGFSLDYSWIDFVDLHDSNGKVKQNRGITNIDGLYFLGLPWQSQRGSALLYGVGNDAKALYMDIIDRM